MDPFRFLAGTLCVCVILGRGGQHGGGFVVEGAAASEWSLGPTEEYVTAFINLTYLENKKLHTEKSEVR